MAETPDKYVFEPALWALAVALVVQVAFDNLVSPFLPAVSIPWPGGWLNYILGGIGVVVVLAFGLVVLAIYFQVGGWIAAKRRGLTKDEYWDRYDSAKREKDRERAERRLQTGVGKIEDALDTEFYTGSIDRENGSLTIRIREET